MTTISAQTILRSRNARAPEKVLSTLLLHYPRCIHAELMTHRVFSRNSASSRAIPVAKMIQSICDDPFVPLHWGANQKGMQASEECDNMIAYGIEGLPDFSREEAWYNAINDAIANAQAFADAGYHKQIVNRLLEPFMHIVVLVSSTEWDNFLALRDHEAAEPHIRILAQQVRAQLERDDSIQALQAGEWHLPFASCFRGWTPEGELPAPATALMHEIKRSTAMCASTSYKTVDGFDMTVERGIELHDKLVGSHPMHASPTEHIAQADDRIIREKDVQLSDAVWLSPELHRNFVGFNQYRAMLVA